MLPRLFIYLCVQTASSTVTLSLPTIALALLVLFGAGWFTGIDASHGDSLMGSIFNTNALIVAGAVVVLTVILIFSGVGFNKPHSPSGEISPPNTSRTHGSDTEVLVRSSQRKRPVRGESPREADPDST
jgi:hypothetical protein